MGVEARIEAAETARIDQRWSLFVTLAVLNVLDVITTELVIQAGGHETNPLIKPIVDSVLAVSLVKAIALLVVGLLLARCRPSRAIDVALTLTTGWYVAVVIWNTVVLALL
ncbi:MAG: DUF5658 family protein [Actinomycetota bacterium]